MAIQDGKQKGKLKNTVIDNIVLHITTAFCSDAAWCRDQIVSANHNARLRFGPLPAKAGLEAVIWG